MVSAAALAVPYGFSVLLICYPNLHGAVTTAQATATQWDLERLAATALIPAVLATLLLTPLLSFALVRATIGRDGAAGGIRRRRLVVGLAKATVLAATAALVACAVLQLRAADGAAAAVVQIGADGHLDRGRGDVARLNIK